MLQRCSFILCLLFSTIGFADSNSDLEQAIWAKDLDGVRTALANRADPSLLDGNRHTWLHICTIAGFAEGIDVLIDAGTPVDGQDDLNQTAAHLAASDGHVAILRTLHRRGANLFLRDRSGRRPIDIARLWRHEGAVTMLLEQEIAAQGQEPGMEIAREANPARPRGARRFFCCFGLGSSTSN